MLLYDGPCRFCDWTVRVILAQDGHGSMRFAQLQGAFARDVLARHSEVRGVDSLILIEHLAGVEERLFVRSDAALRIAEYLGGTWRLARPLRLVPRPLRDWGYDLFARYRYRLFGRYDACPVPPPEVRARFLD